MRVLGRAVWTSLIGQRPVTNGQKIEQEIELTVDIEAGEYSKEDFFPSEISVCLPAGVEAVLGEEELETDENEDEKTDDTEIENDNEIDNDTDVNQEADDHAPEEGYTCEDIDVRKNFKIFKINLRARCDNITRGFFCSFFQ